MATGVGSGARWLPLSVLAFSKRRVRIGIAWSIRWIFGRFAEWGEPVRALSTRHAKYSSWLCCINRAL